MSELTEMPWDEVTERGLLSCMLRVPALAFEVRDMHPAWFWLEKHRNVWRAIKECASAEPNGAAMLVQVDNWLVKRDLLERIGETKTASRKWLRALNDEALSPQAEWSLRYEQLRALWLRRSMISSSMNLRDAAARPGNPDEVIQHMASALTGLAMRQPRDEHFDLARWASEIEAVHSGRESVVRIPTNVQVVDELLDGGVTLGHYTIIAARPKIGKSRLAIRIAFNLLAAGVAVDFWSQEMTNLDITDLFATAMTGVPGDQLRRKDTTHDWASIMVKARAELSALPIRLRCGSAHVRDIVLATRARRAQLGDDVPMAVIVDYIQVFSGSGDKEYERITDVTQQLASLARDSNVWVCGLAQFNRQAGAGMPKPHMLRGSGQIEQDVNELIIFHRPHAGDESADQDKKNAGELWLALNRHGESRKMPLMCDAERLRFSRLGDMPF